MSAADRFRQAIAARDVEAMVETLAPDVRFFNPSSPEPFEGRERVRMVARVLHQLFEDFAYTHVLSGGPPQAPGAITSHAVVFHARVGQRGVQGVDMLDVDDRDLVATFTVMLRPRAALDALTDAVQARLAAGRRPS